jgi:ubiquinone/menaquinone biosynthesis C-methylase UbiE
MDTYLERIRREELEAVKDWFRPRMRVLEIGGGSGFQAAILASWGCHVVSLDVAQKPSPGRQMFQKQYFPVAIYDGLHLPFGDAEFDLVYSSNMLYHVLPLPEFLAEIQRVLRPGGVALHIIPSASCRWWTSLAHYIHVAGIVRRKLGLVRRPDSGASGPAADRNNPNLETLARRIQRLLRADPLGPYPSASHELLAFRRARWVAAFHRAGYEGIDPRPNGLFYTGYLLCPGLPFGFRRRLARWLGSSCHVIAMRNPGTAFARAQR